MIAPAAALIPAPVTATAAWTPWRSMKRAPRARPPTLAGVTQFTNDAPTWATNVGQGGSRSGTEPIALMVAATKLSPDMATIAGSQRQSAPWIRWARRLTSES